MLPLPDTLASIEPIRYCKQAPGRVDWMSGPIPGQEGRQNRQTGGEILAVHIYRNEGK
jgi:hypothetical protein